jgi:cytochrome oxidase assembly protein ShyY1
MTRPPRFLVTPKWIGFHLLCLGGIVLMLNLSLWQWNRLQDRQDFNAVVEERRDQEVVRLEDIVPPGSDAATADTVEWRPAQAEGTYIEGESFLVVNRSQGGTAGSNLVTPMLLDDGRVLLVNRGFLALDDDVPPLPDGRVTVAGIVRASEERRFGGLTSSGTTGSDGLPEVPRIDIESLADTIDGDLLPVSLEVRVSVPEDSESLAPVPAPELSQGSHLSYAIQWLIFSACVAVGWVFAVRRSIRTHRAETAGMTDPDGSTDETGPVGPTGEVRAPADV